MNQPYHIKRLVVCLALAAAGVVMLLTWWTPQLSAAATQAADFSTSTKTAVFTYTSSGALITYTIVARNTGDLAASIGVTETPPVGTIPVACLVTRGVCLPVSGRIWTGDVDTNDAVTFTYVIQAPGHTMNWPVVNVAEIGPDTVVSVTVILNPQTHFSIWLPVILRNYDLRPDLLPILLTVSPPSPAVGQPATITLEFRNIGLSSAQDFWIDLYISPYTPPTGPNQSWDILCAQPFPDCYGGAWYVDEPVAPGQVVHLTSQDFVITYSHWGGWLPSGAHTLYAYVDSWGADTAWGMINERDENNNRIGPVAVTVTGVQTKRDAPVQSDPIPVRPDKPPNN
jgi:hypothetical protein